MADSPLFYFLIVSPLGFSPEPLLAWEQGGVLREEKPEAKGKVVLQPRGPGVSEAPALIRALVTPRRLCSVFLTFSENFSVFDLCNTNELWAINDGFKASGLGFVACGWERGGYRSTVRTSQYCLRVWWEGP